MPSATSRNSAHLARARREYDALSPEEKAAQAVHGLAIPHHERPLPGRPHEAPDFVGDLLAAVRIVEAETRETVETRLLAEVEKTRRAAVDKARKS